MTGQRWEPSQKLAEHLAHATGQLVRDEFAALNTDDPKVAAAYYSRAKRDESAGGIRDILQLARALPEINGDGIEWDADPSLLNCDNGTIDIRTGELREHRREDYITKLSPVKFDPHATCPRWLQFLDEVFNSDLALIDYFQWAAGYSVTADVSAQVFFLLIGPGSNGKSTAIRLLQYIAGDYAQQIDAEQLLQQKHAQHSCELAMLRGARFVAAVETAAGRRVNEALVKHLSGGDKIRARLMRENSAEFTPVLKLWLSSNHAPSVRDDSLGFWRRCRLIPFRVSFQGNGDPKLFDTLCSEASGILNWLVEGARRHFEGGEPPIPNAVKVATDEYRAGEDTLSRFIADECETGDHLAIEKTKLHAAYREYTGGRGGSPHDLTKRLRARGFDDSRRVNNKPFWRGIALLPNDLWTAK